MGTNQGRKVRVIANIRGFTGRELESGNEVSTKQVLVHKPKGEESESVSISFGDHSAGRKESYEVDYCYEQNEENDLIFSKEVKPLISGVFDGCDATVIAYGARGSGKTYLIQGSDEEHGLAVLAMTEVLRMAEENGKSITISLYEIIQDNVREHLHDLLDLKRPLNSVFEAQGKSQRKGISQVLVKSVPEFKKLYFSGRNLRKPIEKIATEHPPRSHKVLIIHVSSHGEKSDGLLVGKMNFVDLAGYEGTRRRSTDGHTLAENTRINKSVYALQNVVYALNANESHIPYRESKLALMLRDSLGGRNKTLMVTCLSPFFCQDSMYIVSLASRSCQGMNRAVSDSTKKTKSSVKPMVSSQKSRIPESSSGTVKKQTGPRMQFSEKKAKANSMVFALKGRSAMKGRRLFNESSHSTKFEKKISSSDIVPIIEPSVSEEKISSLDIVSIIEPSVLEEEKSTSDFAKALVTLEVKISSSDIVPIIEPSVPEEKNLSLDIVSSIEPSVLEEEKSTSDFAKALVPLEVKISSSDIVPIIEPSVPEEKISSSEIVSIIEPSMLEEEKSTSDFAKALVPLEVDVFVHCRDNHEEVAQTMDSSFVEEEKENNHSLLIESVSPPISAQLQELSNNLKMLFSSTPSCMEVPPRNDASFNGTTSTDILDPKTPEQSVRTDYNGEISNVSNSPWQALSMRSSKVKNSLVQEYLRFLNSASKEELKKIKGIGEKRATYILELREESPEPFKNLDDLKDIGLSAKQIKGMMKKEVGELFD